MTGATTLRTIAVLICTAPLLYAGHAAAAAVPQPTVTVSGTGTASATPDELSLALDISTQAPTVRAALDAASAAMTKVRDKLLADGVAAADLQTTDLSLQPQYSQQNTNTITITGYEATESVNAELRHLSTAGQAISDAVDAGGNAVRLNNVAFDLTDQRARLLAKARASAVADAKSQAAEDAAAAGRKLGQVLNITESDESDVPHPPLPLAMFAARANAVPLAPGSQQVTVTVIVSYELA